MSLYLKLFENHNQYTAYTASTEFIKPNVSHCIQEVEVHYNPWTPPMNVITYTATAKLTETTSTGSTNGLHVNSFSGSSGQLTKTSHTFDNGIGEIEFDGDVTSIGTNAFRGCIGLTSIVIPNSVTSIGGSAFASCTALTSIDIPSGVTGIGTYAFDSCKNLTSIVIPNSVTSIDEYTFYGCTSLTSITSNAMTAPTIQNSTFRDVKTNGALYAPQGSSGYDVWMGTGNYYLGKYGWTRVEQ